MRGPGLLAGTTVLSVALHAGLAVVVAFLFDARPADQDDAPSSEVALSTLAVPESTAEAQTPNADRAPTGAIDTEHASSRVIPKSVAKSNIPNATRLPSQAPPETILDPAASNTFELAGTKPESARLDGFDLSGRPLVSRPFAAEMAIGITARPRNIASTQPEETTLSSAPATVAPTTPAPLDARRLTGLPGSGQATPPAPTNGTRLTTTPTPSAPIATGAPQTELAILAKTPSEAASVVLAWSGTLSIDLPEATVETSAALRIPESDGTGLRDALATRLAGVDCARVQTVYDPETGAVDLRGHVKDDADRTRLLDHVSAELNEALPVVDRLRKLEAPQCTVLVHLAEMALPQSVDQLTNPLIIGADLQTRTYSYTDGQTMSFDLAGADYDAWLYLDYFDSEGRVLHLLPNEFIDPVFLPAETPLVFGDGTADDPARGKFEMRVSPPFGEDIAVAMVSNMPLFEAPRPTVEEAGPYLEALASRVADLRAEPGFKGEWVYIFVETTAP